MSNNHIEQIKAKILPSTLIARYLQLKHKGNGEFLGLCPFHEEKSPSFTVSDRKGFYHCFGCSASGDIFTFLVNHEGLSYREALERMAAEAQVDLPQSHKEEQHKAEKLAPLYNLFEKAAQFYNQQLHGREGMEALQYLKARGLTTDTIAEFKLGYAPQNDGSLLKLLRSHFDEKIILDSKLFIQGKSLYSPFNGRVMFPIENRRGQVIAFGGRTLKKTEAAKYINSMENPIFHKSDVLYNMSRATRSAFKQGSVIVVEGYMDVIALANAGIGNAVAPLGANVKVEQVMSLWPIVNEPTICLDSDRAGQTAALRLAKAILPHLSAGKSLKFCHLNGAKDPDELIKKSGVTAMNHALGKSLSLVDFLFSSELEQVGPVTPERKLHLQEKLTELAALIQNPTLGKIYQQFFKNKVYEAFAPKPYKKIGKHNTNMAKFSKDILTLMAIEESEVISILATCAIHPLILKYEDLREALHSLEIKTNELSLTRDFLLSISEDDGATQLVSLEQEIIEKFGLHFDKKRLDPTLYDSERSLVDIKTHALRTVKIQMLQHLITQIKEVELLLKQNADIKLFDRLVYLKQQETLIHKEIS